MHMQLMLQVSFANRLMVQLCWMQSDGRLKLMNRLLLEMAIILVVWRIFNLKAGGEDKVSNQEPRVH